MTITLTNLTQQVTTIATLTQQNLPVLSIILIILWGILLFDTLMQHRLCMLGIIPRRWYGLPGIIFAPFLHANATHLFFNCIPLIVLSDFLLFNGINYFISVSLQIGLISGLCIWCCAKPGVHIGASAIITGYWSLLVCNSYYEHSVISIILGIICIYYFIGIFYSIFPQKKGISWEGHLFGLLAGVIVGLFG